MSKLVILLAITGSIIGCTSATSVNVVPSDDKGHSSTTRNRTTCSPGDSYGYIAGRVLLDTNPVPFFGVSAVTSSSLSVSISPSKIRSDDGRFRVRMKAGESFDVIIAGPLFARRVLLANEVQPCQTNELGDILVSPGRAIRGKVVNVLGGAIQRAEVVVVHGGAIPVEGDVLLNLANRVYREITDDDGNFLISGIGHESGGLTLSVVSGELRSGEVAVRPGVQQSITVMPTGSMIGTVSRFDSDMIGADILARSTSNRSMSLSSQVDDQGHFVLSDVPEGTYDVFLVEYPQTSQRIAVTAGHASTVQL